MEQSIKKQIEIINLFEHCFKLNKFYLLLILFLSSFVLNFHRYQKSFKNVISVITFKSIFIDLNDIISQIENNWLSYFVKVLLQSVLLTKC